MFIHVYTYVYEWFDENWAEERYEEEDRIYLEFREGEDRKSFSSWDEFELACGEFYGSDSLYGAKDRLTELLREFPDAQIIRRKYVNNQEIT